jgi:hypothetical protein
MRNAYVNREWSSKKYRGSYLEPSSSIEFNTRAASLERPLTGSLMKIQALGSSHWLATGVRSSRLVATAAENHLGIEGGKHESAPQLTLAVRSAASCLSPVPSPVRACPACSWRAAACSAGGDGGRRSPELSAHVFLGPDAPFHLRVLAARIR